MASQKRKADGTLPRACSDCFPNHKSDLECQREAERRKHREISDKIILFSRTVELSIDRKHGKLVTALSVHTELLILHSMHSAAQGCDDGSDAKIKLPTRDADHLREFVSYLYTGQLADVSIVGASGVSRDWKSLWKLGEDLQCPGFQNICMDGWRGYCKYNNPYPVLAHIDSAYTGTQTGSMLRKFAVDLMAKNNPFKIYPKGSKDYQIWERFVRGEPDIMMDFMVAAAENWNDGAPWDEKHRLRYMVADLDVAERWDERILSTRVKADIEKAAKVKDYRSMIELEHLDRYK